MSDRPRIVITRPLPGGAAEALRAEGFDDLQANEEDRALSRDELLAAVPGAAAILSTPVDRIDAEVLDAAGDRLVIVSNYAVGYDNVDVDECRRRGIVVGHTPNAVTEPTADIAWLLILAAARRAREGFDLVRSGRWSGVGPNQLLGTRLVGKTLLIVGAGRIGHATARRALGWEMDILYCARTRHEEFETPPLHARRVDLETGLREADVVSLHTPLTDETRHLINAERLAMMKPTAILVNTARGAVVDEAALTEALRERRIAAAGLDVFEHEPALHPGLADLDNVFLLPHLGSATVEDREWMIRIAVANIIAALRGDTPPHTVA